MRKIKKETLKGILILLIVALIFAMQTPIFAVDERPFYLKIATSTMGGTWFPTAAAIAEVINTNVPNIIATATLGAADSNILNIENGTIMMAFTTSNAMAAAVNATRKPFEKPVTKVRALASIYETPIQIVAPVDTNITHVRDVVGKRVNAFIKGGSLEVAFKRILEEHGITYEDIKAAGGSVTHVGYNEEIGMTKDRLLDVSIYMTPAPSSQIMDIETARPITLLKMDDVVLDKIVEELPFYTKRIVKAGTYKGLKEDVATVSVVHMIIVSESLPEDLVYNITKAIFENTDIIGAIHPVVKKELNIKNATKGLTVTLHPGAEKYYKEKGVY